MIRVDRGMNFNQMNRTDAARQLQEFLEDGGVHLPDADVWEVFYISEQAMDDTVDSNGYNFEQANDAIMEAVGQVVGGEPCVTL